MKKQDVIIRSSDVFMSYKNPYLICRINENTKKINGGAISSILVLENCTIDSSVFDLINRYEISILFHNGSSSPKGKCTPFVQKLNKDAYKKQLELSIDGDTEFRKVGLQWLQDKFSNRQKLLEAFLPSERKQQIEKYQKQWYQDLDESSEATDPMILVREAHSSKIYWNLYNKCLPHALRFKKRSKHPGLDLTNILLNYGYGILYSVIEKCITSQGLDPTCGIFHVDGPGRKSLVYDMIEAQRYVVEQMVLEFCIQKKDVLEKEEFKTTQISNTVKNEFISTWKRYNEKNKVTTIIKEMVQNFKTKIIVLKNEEV